jgi:hypothetical protein
VSRSSSWASIPCVFSQCPDLPNPAAPVFRYARGTGALGTRPKGWGAWRGFASLSSLPLVVPRRFPREKEEKNLVREERSA